MTPTQPAYMRHTQSISDYVCRYIVDKNPVFCNITRCRKNIEILPPKSAPNDTRAPKWVERLTRYWEPLNKINGQPRCCLGPRNFVSENAHNASNVWGLLGAPRRFRRSLFMRTCDRSQLKLGFYGPVPANGAHFDKLRVLASLEPE